jgi:hypothetical protein
MRLTLRYFLQYSVPGARNKLTEEIDCKIAGPVHSTHAFKPAILPPRAMMNNTSRIAESATTRSLSCETHSNTLSVTTP